MAGAIAGRTLGKQRQRILQSGYQHAQADIAEGGKTGGGSDQNRRGQHGDQQDRTHPVPAAGRRRPPDLKIPETRFFADVIQNR